MSRLPIFTARDRHALSDRMDFTIAAGARVTPGASYRRFRLASAVHAQRRLDVLKKVSEERRKKEVAPRDFAARDFAP